MNVEYKIIEASTKEEFCNKINEKAKDGWFSCNRFQVVFNTNLASWRYFDLLEKPIK